MATAPKTITGREALKRVLEKEGGPMKVSDLTAAAVKIRGVKLKGKTPEQTLAAILYVDAKQDTGDFVKLDRGLIGLRERKGERGRES